MKRLLIPLVLALLVVAFACGLPGAAAGRAGSWRMEGLASQTVISRLAPSLYQDLALVKVSSWRAETCRYARFDGSPHWTEHEIRLAIACAVHHFPVPGGVSYALCICEHESHFYRHAVSPTGEYLGLYQLSLTEFGAAYQARADLWRHRWNVARDIFNPRSNVLMGITKAHDQGDWDGWSTVRFC